MKKSDLKSGAIVELRNKIKLMLLLNANNFGNKDDIFVDLRTGDFTRLSNYDEDMKNICIADFDIMKVSQPHYVGDNFRNHIFHDGDEWDWIRDEEVIMTISEIEEKLGIRNLKIKKED